MTRHHPCASLPWMLSAAALLFVAAIVLGVI
jgi:hypothetical protein